MDVKEEKILGNSITSHFYYVSKGRALHHLLKTFHFNSILDIGAGSGIFSRQLLEKGIGDQSVCLDPAYENEYTEIYHNKPITFVRSVEKTTQDLILMMDVLEHVDDDVELLKKYITTMPKDGKILITVPAFQFLWSAHDVFLEHRRRYTLQQLESVVQQAGLKIIALRYFFGLLFPVVVLLRLYKRKQLEEGKIRPESSLKIYPPFVNTLLILIHDLERFLFFPFNRWVGLTIFCLAEPLKH